MKKPLVIFGTDKMGELAHFYFSRDSDYDPVAFTVDAQYVKDREFRGLPVLPFEEVEGRFPPAQCAMFVAIGYTKLNKLRAEKYAAAKAKGYSLASYVSSRLTAWEPIAHGDNCFILEHQVFQPDVTIGNDVVVWSGNHFGHDVVVGDHSWIASHVVLSGHTHVGCHCFVGINVSIRDGVNIADECIIGAGAVLLHSTKAKTVYVAKGAEKYALNSEAFLRMTDISRESSSGGEGVVRS